MSAVYLINKDPTKSQDVKALLYAIQNYVDVCEYHVGPLSQVVAFAALEGVADPVFFRKVGDHLCQVNACEQNELGSHQVKKLSDAFAAVGVPHQGLLKLLSERLMALYPISQSGQTPIAKHELRRWALSFQALSCLDYNDPKLYTHAAELTIRELTSMNEQVLTVVLHAFARCRHAHPTLLHHTSSLVRARLNRARVNKQPFTPQTLVTLAMLWVRLDVHDLRLFEALGDALAGGPRAHDDPTAISSTLSTLTAEQLFHVASAFQQAGMRHIPLKHALILALGSSQTTSVGDETNNSRKTNGEELEGIGRGRWYELEESDRHALVAMLRDLGPPVNPPIVTVDSLLALSEEVLHTCLSPDATKRTEHDECDNNSTDLSGFALELDVIGTDHAKVGADVERISDGFHYVSDRHQLS